MLRLPRGARLVAAAHSVPRSACEIAVDFTHKFKSDIIVDVIGYRRHGHNEVDEPSFTQPLMYKTVRSSPSVVANYAKQLEGDGVANVRMRQEALAGKLKAFLDKELDASDAYTQPANRHFQGKWASMRQATSMTERIVSGVAPDVLQRVGIASITLPADFNVHDRLRRGHVDARHKVITQGAGIDWASAEALAFGSLMLEGHNVRLTGQDVERGTFSHRHAVMVDQVTERKFCPLNQLREGNPRVGELRVFQRCVAPPCAPRCRLRGHSRLRAARSRNSP